MERARASAKLSDNTDCNGCSDSKGYPRALRSVKNVKQWAFCSRGIQLTISENGACESVLRSSGGRRNRNSIAIQPSRQNIEKLTGLGSRRELRLLGSRNSGR